MTRRPHLAAVLLAASVGAVGTARAQAVPPLPDAGTQPTPDAVPSTPAPDAATPLPDAAPVPEPVPAPVPDPGTDPDPDPDTVPDPDTDSVPDTDPDPDPDPDPAAAAARIGVRGVITDAETGTPLPGVVIEQVGGAGASTTTDDDGRFTLALPRGSYTLRVRGDLYQVRRVRNVAVRGGLTSLDVALRLDDLAVEEVVVEAEPDRKSEAANLAERRRSATVQDAVSAQEMSRTPDSSAGDAVKRVVSATVVGGRYVFVRGLGGRYSTTLLNGVVLPSPDPDSTAVPLDLFPAALVANLTVVKSYTPDLPGAFAGGDLVIQTNTYPQDFEMKFKVSASGDSVSTFRDRLDYRGGSTDWLSFDDGTRALPGDVPTDRPLRVGSTGVGQSLLQLKLGGSPWGF